MRSLQRLLWKEYRESGAFVLCGVLQPLFCLAFQKLRGDFVQFPIVVVVVIVAVWASVRAQEQRDALLPITAPMRLFIHYLVPMLGALAIGVSLGYFIQCRLDERVRMDYIPLTVGICVLLFAFCTLITSVYALIPSLLAGVALAMSSFAIFANPLTFNLPALHASYQRTLFVVIATAVYWECYRGKYRVLCTRIALPLLLLLAVSWGAIRLDDIGDFGKYLQLSSHQSYINYQSNLYSDFNNIDDTLRMDYVYPSHKAELCLLDMSIPQRYFISPERISAQGDYQGPLICLDRRVVLFAAQAPSSADVRVLAWNTRTGQVSERFRFTAWRGMMQRYRFATYSPDNRYILIHVSSKIGQGVDSWQLDLQRNRATLHVGGFYASLL